MRTPEQIKKKKKIVTVQQSTIDFVNYNYKNWCIANGVDFEDMLLSKVNK